MNKEEIVDRFIKKDKLAQHLGIEVYDVRDGSAKGRMRVEEFHLNSAGTVHGGAIFALADAVFSAASNSRGTLAMAINVSISYFKAVREGMLFAEAKEVSVNPKLGTYLITIKDEQGHDIALFQGTVYRKSTPLEDIIGG